MAFERSWSLTLVILSAVPILMIVQTASQIFAGPPLECEREQTAQAGTLVERAVAAVSTVKAFNAQPTEVTNISRTLEHIRASADRCNAIWGITSAFSQFATYAMFIQGFWYGAREVRAGRISAGDVMAVFWACLIATSNLQMGVPQLLAVAKGKFAMAALAATAATNEDLEKRSRRLRKIQPRQCAGELELKNVGFCYPGRPDVKVLDDVSMLFAAGEYTFVVGGSGSGKSTVAQLLLRMYEASQGNILFDEQEMSYLDSAWTRQQVACVSQQCLLFDRSVHDNVAMGLAGPGSLRRPEHATREEVIEACRAAMMHDFIRDLPDGYDTMLGNSGANLSGGQKQRLAIARALLRNPTVLILGKLSRSPIDFQFLIPFLLQTKRRQRWTPRPVYLSSRPSSASAGT
jgi:ATP-binding cassette subfamily B (MDR/TAP) protein 1